MIVVAAASTGFAVRPVAADGVSDQQQQVKNDLASIKSLEQKSSQLNEEYLGFSNEKAQLDSQIADSQKQIDAQAVQLSSLQTQLASVAVQQFTGGASGGLAMFGDTSSATDSLQREQLVRTAVNAGAATTDDYNALLAQQNHAQAELQAKHQKATRLATQASDALDRTKQAGQAYQDELAKDQATLGVLLVQEQQREQAAADAAHAAAVQQAKAAEQAAADQSAAKVASQNQAAQNQAAQNQAAQNSPSGQQAGPSAKSPAPTPGSQTPVVPAVTPQVGKKVSEAAPTPTTAAGGDFGGASAAKAGGSADAGGGSVSSPLVAGGTTAPAPPPVSSRAEIAIAAARSQLGVRYQFAMASPGVAFDCSGVTSYAWAQAGVSIPHQSAQQFATTPHVATADIQPGDLLFFYHPISHVSIYIGNGQEIQAPAPGKFVEIANVDWAGLVGASRPG